MVGCWILCIKALDCLNDAIFIFRGSSSSHRQSVGLAYPGSIRGFGHPFLVDRTVPGHSSPAGPRPGLPLGGPSILSGILSFLIALLSFVASWATFSPWLLGCWPHAGWEMHRPQGGHNARPGSLLCGFCFSRFSASLVPLPWCGDSDLIPSRCAEFLPSPLRP